MSKIQILLASASPRRRELIKLISDDVVCLSCDVDETIPDGLSPEEAVVMLARRKAEAAGGRAGERTVVSADTIVVKDSVIFGKPKDEADACRMLTALSGSVHEVITGVCVIFPDGRKKSFFDKTLVEFYPLTKGEIEEYVASGEPMDKAGAYGIQERGALLVKEINGNFYNVMGLPVAMLARELDG